MRKSAARTAATTTLLLSTFFSSISNADDAATGPGDESVDTPPAVDPTKPPSVGKGALWGVVSSSSNKESLPDSQVTVIGRKESSTTDLDGRFRIELPAGVYTLRIASEFHRMIRVRNIRVATGRIVRFDVSLSPDDSAVEDAVAVEAEVERASAGTQLLLRKNAAGASDAVGAQDIAKSPDRNAADAIKRVVGATVVDGRYLLVRGLGDRYMNAQLNGSPLPSPEPDRQAVPLDMFPSLVLSDMVVRKTFTPDIPGDFAGGSLDIHTRDIPSKLFFSANLGVGFNSESTFRDRRSYRGGSLDFLGMDDGTRKIPGAIPDKRVTRLNPDGTLNKDLTAQGKSLSSSMASEPAFTLPNGSGNAVVGDSFKIGGKDSKSSIGYLVGLGYSRRFQIKRDEVIRTFGVDPLKPGQLVRFNDYRVDTGTDNVNWSALGEVRGTLNERHNVYFTGMYSRSAEKEARLVTGYSDEQNAEIRDERLRFLNRGLTYAQLRGEHRIKETNEGTFGWKLLWARATLGDPDMRQTVYQRDTDTGFAFREGTQSGMHFYGAQAETTRSLGLDYTQPLNKDPERPKSVKLGTLFTLRGRSFDVRRFRFLRVPSADQATFRQPPNELFNAGNVGPALELDEWTRPTDTYDARYDVVAGYAMTDLALTKAVRIVFGPRVESSTQTVTSFDPFAAEATKAETNLTRLDLLPAMNVQLKPTDKLVFRGAVSRTVARPQLRELAPFIFTEFLGAREVLGNPKLDRTSIWNFDLRAEYYPSPTEVLALSLFHKHFDKPIEPTILPTSRGVLSYLNAEGASNTGIELEGRKSLSFVHKALSDFGILANVTVLHSRVTLDKGKVGLLTNTERPLAGQSPFVTNVALDYDNQKTRTRARLLYNISGARISQVGMNGLPDTYEQPRNVLDLSVAQGFGEHVDLKLSLENILDAPYRFTQGDSRDALTTNRYALGRSLWITGSYTY